MKKKRIRMAETRLDGQEMAAVIDCMMEGNLRAGKCVADLENRLSWNVGAYNSIAVSNGTTALYMVFKAILEPGDRVIIPAFNFIAAANAVVLAGGVPVFVDVDEKTWLISASRMKDALEFYYQSGNPVKAVCPVHLFGNPCDVAKIKGLADGYGARTVWDACQAYGAKVGGDPIGGQGAATIFSFYPTKPLFGAEGGAICYCEDLDGMGSASLLPMREHGWMFNKYESEMVGGNFRMNELSAAIVLTQISHGLEHDRAKRRSEISALIRNEVEPEFAQAQRITTGCKSADSVLALFFQHRDRVQGYLEREGIETSIHYPVPLNRQKSMERFAVFRCPISEYLAEHLLSVPCHHGMTDDDVERVVNAIKKAARG
jgi:dTDP-4-amino-4,6-dideoxygalactose transaminase